MNPDTDECDTDEVPCPEGSTMNTQTGECDENEGPDTCPDGSTMPADGNCGSRNDTPETCPDGSPMPPTGDNCGQNDDDDDIPPPPPFTCPAGTTMKENGDGTLDEDDCVVDVEGTTIIGPITPSSVDEVTPQVLGTELVAAPETAAVLGVELSRPEAVLGVQVERAAVAPAALARTGANSNTGLLVLLAAFLLALGSALVRVGRRRNTAGI
jgi:hypothetical protein